MARNRASVSTTGELACEKATQPAFFRPDQFGRTLAFKAQGQRAERQETRLADFVAAMDQAVGQLRLIKRWVGVGRHNDAGHATGDGRGQLGFDAVQPGAEVDQAGADDTAGRIDTLLRREASGGLTQPGNLAIGNK